MRLRRLVRLGVVAGFVAAATLVATAAHAALGLYRVESVSVSDASSPKNITVSCAAGDVVVGMGGRISGSPDVLLTRVFADTGLTQVTASGIEATPTGDAWSVKAIAVCAPASTVTDPQLVEATSGSNPNDKIVTANCPNGTLLFGGGYRLEQADGQVVIAAFEFDLRQVRTEAYVHGTVGDFRLKTQAICATFTAASWVVILSESTSASNSISPKTETSPVCGQSNPPAEVAAVGAVVTGGGGQVGLTALSPRLQAGAAEATAREVGPYAGSWTIKTQVLCIG